MKEIESEKSSLFLTSLYPVMRNSSWTPIYNQGVLNVKQMETLSYIYLASALLSLLGSSSIVAAASIKKKVLNREVHPIFQLSLADLFGSILLLAGAVSYHVLKSRAIYSSSCRYLTGFASSTFMSTFLLTLNYAWAINKKVKDRLNGDGDRRVGRSTKRSNYFKRMGVSHCTSMGLLYGCSWFIPLMLTLTMFAIDSGGHGIDDNICTSCLPMFHYKNSNCQATDPSYKNEPDFYSIYKFIFIAVLIVSMLGSVMLYFMIYQAFKSAQIFGGVISQRQRDTLRTVRRRLGLFCVVFLFCWLPSLILGLISFSSSFSMDKFYWLYILQASTCPLQGFVNCIIYGWYRPGFRNSITERTPLVHSTSLQSEM